MYRYQLDEKSEKILFMLSDTLTDPSNTYEALTDSDMTYDDIILSDGSKIELTYSNYYSYRNIHKQVFDLLYDIYTNFKNTITSTYTGYMDSNITIAKLKGFKSAREASFYSDNVYINL